MGDPLPLGPPPGLDATVGRYRLDAPVGMGGMASVYRATDPDGRVVAVKILHPQSVLPEEVKRFTREFEALSGMDHPNIVRVHEAGVTDKFPWIAMEFVEGVDLDKRIAAWQEAPEQRWEALDAVFRGLCRGLQYVHDRGLVHRDLKPTNVLVTLDGQPKISDFGVVKDPDATGTQLTKAGRLVGTVAFMAPEQITGEKVDTRADLYSLGAVLYMMLTFKRPIEATSVAGYLARHLTEVPRAPSEIDPTVPPRLEQVCMRLLAKVPGQRYPTALAALQALDRPPDAERAPLRGRDDLMTRWNARLAALGKGGGAVIGLTGPGGIGLSFTLQAMVEAARGHGFRTVLVRGPDGALGARIARALDVGPGDPWQLLPPAVGAQPTLLAIDDVDACLPAEIEALGRLVRDLLALSGAPLLVLVTAHHTDGVAQPLLGGRVSGMPADLEVLDALDRAAVTTLVRDRGVGGAAAPQLGRRLHADFGGLPGLISDQVDALFDAGWLVRLGDSVTVERTLDELRQATLPVPATVRDDLDRKLTQVDALQRELVEALALLGRPTAAAVLEHCTTRATGAAMALTGLVGLGILRRCDDETEERVQLSHPTAASVLIERLDPATRRERHARIARSLAQRRRRDAVKEVADHLVAAGQPTEAYPMYVKAARRAARAARIAEVFEVCASAEAIREAAAEVLGATEVHRLRRWLSLLAGDAWLARGRWEEALPLLHEAVDPGPDDGEDDGGVRARGLGSLGRAYYRLGRFQEATPLLERALALAEPGAPERAAATRALADIRLRAGDLDNAERLFVEALLIATEIGSRDAEARARRGLAHLRALQGRFVEAMDFLETASDLLDLGGDDRVRAGVLARIIELDIVAGRYGSAVHRADGLIDLAQRAELGERMPEAYAMHAEVMIRVGDTETAIRSARNALSYARGIGSPTWDARLRAARVLCDAGCWSEIEATLPPAESLPNSRVDDPSAQLATLRARWIATDRALDARDLARWALARPQPALGIRGARIALDAALALTRSGDGESARSAAKRGLRCLAPPGVDGLQLELLLALHDAGPDPRVRAAAITVANRIAATLTPHLATLFRERPAIAALLGRGGPHH